MNREDFPLTHAGMASDFALQEQYYEEGRVFILQIESTLKCPQLCNYCYADSKPGSPDGLSSRKIMELLDSAAKLEVKMIDWLGGDPLVREDWYDLCQYASNLGLINNIWTSGLPLANPKIANQAVKASRGGFISTHLDTTDSSLYKILHDVENEETATKNINILLKGIRNTLDAGKKPSSMVNCITYTSPLAKGDTKRMISYMQDTYGIKTCLTLFNPVVHRSDNKEWEPSIKEIEDAFTYRDHINYPGDPSFGAMDVSKFYCGSVICVKADGWLTPCSVIQTKEFGNIENEKLEVLIEKKKERLLMLDFRDESKLPGNCGKCVNNSHCFGCRSSAYYYEGDVMAADPKCYQFNPKKEKI